MPIPYLRKTPGGTQLIADGVPTLLLGGQVHNSAPSSPPHMRAIFDRLESMHVGTVIGSASWAMARPRPRAASTSPTSMLRSPKPGSGACGWC